MNVGVLKYPLSSGKADLKEGQCLHALIREMEGSHFAEIIKRILLCATTVAISAGVLTLQGIKIVSKSIFTCLRVTLIAEL